MKEYSGGKVNVPNQDKRVNIPEQKIDEDTLFGCMFHLVLALSLKKDIEYTTLILDKFGIKYKIDWLS